MAGSAHPVRPGGEDPPTGAGSLRLQILGPLRLWRDGAELDVGPRQQAQLLALLLAQVGRPVSTGELIDLIWADDVPASALNVIHKYIGALRRLPGRRCPADDRRTPTTVAGQRVVFGAGRTGCWKRCTARQMSGTPITVGTTQYIQCGSRFHSGRNGPLST